MNRLCLRLLFPLLLLLTLVCAAFPAQASDVYIVKDASTAGSISTDCSYLRVNCPLDGSAAVTMSIRDEWGYLLYQRDYGVCSSSFRSEDVYLPLEDGRTSYTVFVTAGSVQHQFRVTREMPRLTDL